MSNRPNETFRLPTLARKWADRSNGVIREALERLDAQSPDIFGTLRGCMLSEDISDRHAWSAMNALPQILGLVLLGTEFQTPTDAMHEMTRKLDERQQMLAVSERWRIGAPDPEDCVPEDIPIIQAILGAMETTAILNNLHEDNEDMVAASVAATAAVLLRAANFYLPQRAQTAVIEAIPPAEELDSLMTIASPVAIVWFAQPIEIPTATVSMSEDVRQWLSSLSAPSPFGHVKEPIELAIANHGGRLHAIRFHSDQSGTILPVVSWIVSTVPAPDASGPMALDRRWGVITGYSPRSFFGGLARSVAATLAWGRWQPPPSPFELPTDQRARRRILTTSSARRQLARGALAGVRVLDMRRTTPRQAPDSTDAEKQLLERCSPCPHWRRPHIRRVRVGPRSAWHYEERQIARSYVQPHGPVRSGEVIWRIPPPKQFKHFSQENTPETTQERTLDEY